MTDLHEYAPLVELMTVSYRRALPLDAERILTTAAQLRDRVGEKAAREGINPGFGDMSAIAALHALAKWYHGLGDQAQAHVDRFMTGDGNE